MNGGPVEDATTLAAGHTSHRFPHFFPDGRHFVFFTVGSAGTQGLYVGSLDNKEIRKLTDSNSSAAFVGPSQLVYVRQGTLFIQKFDLGKLEFVGDAAPIAPGIFFSGQASADASLSGSAGGLFAFRRDPQVKKRLAWFDRSGKEVRLVAELSHEFNLDFDLSLKQTAVALDRANDIWIMDMSRATPQRLTSNPFPEIYPTWSPDETQIVFGSRKKGPLDLYIRQVSASTEEPLVETNDNKWARDWSSDGRLILYHTSAPTTGFDLWFFSLPDKKSSRILETPFNESNAHFAPDQKWIAYTSDESGRNEVYVTSFPIPGRRFQISTNGGFSAHWRNDGRELFYISEDKLMSVPITQSGDVIVAGPSTPLITIGRPFLYRTIDGQRFLINTTAGDLSTPPITLVLNFRGLSQ